MAFGTLNEQILSVVILAVVVLVLILVLVLVFILVLILVLVLVFVLILIIHNSYRFLPTIFRIFPRREHLYSQFTSLELPMKGTPIVCAVICFLFNPYPIYCRRLKRVCAVCALVITVNGEILPAPVPRRIPRSLSAYRAL